MTSTEKDADAKKDSESQSATAEPPEELPTRPKRARNAKEKAASKAAADSDYEDEEHGDGKKKDGKPRSPRVNLKKIAIPMSDLKRDLGVKTEFVSAAELIEMIKDYAAKKQDAGEVQK